MRQILQNLGNGETILADVPAPRPGPRELLIASQRSLVSAGTERMLVEFGKAGLIGKARQQPAKVRQVLDKVRTDGLNTTLTAVRSKLAEPIPLGYCNAGVVIGVGSLVKSFRVGDRVVSNGPHAELVRAGENLCARIPDTVDDEAAAFTVLASIGLQGVRLAAPTIGETVVVTGLGLIGLMTVQILAANGCNVIGIDPDGSRCRLAEKFGARAVQVGSADPVKRVMALTGGTGADAVLITASTASQEPLEQAAAMSRKRGRIILIGVAGTNISREAFYEKELAFQVSCSYGPGRYDPAYEQAGVDYPLPFVRWTEQRNFQAILGLLSSGRLDVKPLITDRYEIAEAAKAYASISGKGSLGVIIEYPPVAEDKAKLTADRIILNSEPSAPPLEGKRQVVCGFLGFGNFGARMLAPAFRKAGVRLKAVVNTGGPAVAVTGKSAGFELASTNRDAVLADDEINAVAIVTRHSDHARSAVECIEAGKSVFVEKPIAIKREELGDLRKAWSANAGNHAGQVFMGGFNRRFAPFSLRMKEWLDRRSEPVSLVLLMNAGAIPTSHWTQDPEVGGGRLIGEAVHMVDLARFLVGHPIVATRCMAAGTGQGSDPASDRVNISLAFADGSTAVVHYLANGSSAYPKERVEAFCGGSVAVIDNFLSIKGFGAKGLKNGRAWKQDKGHEACARAFVEAVAAGSGSPIAFGEMIEVADACFDAMDGIR